MATTGIKLGPGWVKCKAKLDPKVCGKFMQEEVAKATELNARVVAGAMRDELTDKISPRNADLTVALKRSTKPLVDRGQLFQAITGVKVRWNKGEAGVRRRTRRGGRGGSIVDLAKMLHEGGTIPVTNAMRGLFKALWQASQGKLDPAKLSARGQQLFKRYKKWLPLKASTRYIVIPARPFADRAVENEDVQREVAAHWEAAVQRAIARA